MLSSRIHLGSSTRIRKQSIRQSDVERIFNQPPQGAAFQHDLILYEKPNQSQPANGRESTRIQSLRKKEAIPPFLSRSGSVAGSAFSSNRIVFCDARRVAHFAQRKFPSRRLFFASGN